LSAEPRLFVAVPLDESVRARVAGIVEAIRATEPPKRGVRWVRLDGLHITLRFLGPTLEDRIDSLAAALRRASAGGEPFAVTIGGAGAFPPTGRPRTLWLGVREGADELAALNGRLDEALVEAGWAHEERPFRAHLTLARSDGVRAGPTTAAALRAAASDLALESVVDRLVLYESVTGDGRARYIARAEAPIG
jgi:2'-5' RNA ligase